MSDLLKTWQRFFLEWPKDLNRRGVVVTNQGEQVPFEGFMVSDNLLLLERRTPDSVGARKMIIPFTCIDGLKIVDPAKANVFQAVGFQGNLPTG